MWHADRGSNDVRGLVNPKTAQTNPYLLRGFPWVKSERTGHHVSFSPHL